MRAIKLTTTFISIIAGGFFLIGIISDLTDKGHDKDYLLFLLSGLLYFSVVLIVLYAPQNKKYAKTFTLPAFALTAIPTLFFLVTAFIVRGMH